MAKISTILLLFLFALSCTQRVPSKYEQGYRTTADSLQLYKNVPYIEKELISNEKARDFLKMDFNAFKEKHEMTDIEMDVLCEIMQGHVDIARMMNSMEIGRNNDQCQ